MKTLNEVYEEIQNCEGQKINSRLEQLKTMHHIFCLNFDTLNKLFIFMKDDKNVLQLWDVNNREILTQFHREYVRHLFNFLSSVAAYIDTTRNIIKANYDQHSFYKVYQEKIKKTFIDNKLCVFIKDLRNYHTHYEIPISNTELNLSTLPNKEFCKFQIYVKKQDFLKWNSWKEKAKQYLDESPDKVVLEDVCVEYFSIVNTFYDWLNKEIKEQHKSELDHFSNLIEELHKIQKSFYAN